MTTLRGQNSLSETRPAAVCAAEERDEKGAKLYQEFSPLPHRNGPIGCHPPRRLSAPVLCFVHKFRSLVLASVGAPLT